jgi:hypothetical protein
MLFDSRVTLSELGVTPLVARRGPLDDVEGVPSS